MYHYFSLEIISCCFHPHVPAAGDPSSFQCPGPAPDFLYNKRAHESSLLHHRSHVMVSRCRKNNFDIYIFESFYIILAREDVSC